jgi:hypothetical protein
MSKMVRCSFSRRVLEDPPRFRRRVLPAIGGCTPQSAFYQRPSCRRVKPQQRVQLARNIFRTEGIKIHGRSTAYFPVRGNVRDSNRTATRHGLQWRQAESFIERWVNKTCRAGVESWKHIILRRAEQPDSLGMELKLANIRPLAPTTTKVAPSKPPTRQASSRFFKFFRGSNEPTNRI